jgi:dephospho-CoA kinase
MTDKIQRRIGLTGGIGTGKTTVARYLADTYQLPVLDADIYAREAVQLGSPILDEIVKHFGVSVLQRDGTLNRQQLGKIVFNYPDERQWLEAQIHPYVRERFETELVTQITPTVVLALPLLFEAEMTDLVTEIWVVTCSPEQQLQRIIARDALPVEQAKARLNSQLPLTEKVARADIVLDNSSTREALFKQVDTALSNERRQ